MVGPLPDDLLVAADLEGMRAFAFLPADKIADKIVAVLELLHAGDPGDVQFGYILRLEFPRDLFIRCNLDQTLLRAAADERVAIE